MVWDQSESPGVLEFCGSEVAKCTAPETTKRREVGELVEHRGAMLHGATHYQSTCRFHPKGLEHLKK